MPSSSFPKRLHQFAVPLIEQPRAQSSRPFSGFLRTEFSLHVMLPQWFWFPASKPCLRYHATITRLLCLALFCGHQIQFKLHYVLPLSPTLTRGPVTAFLASGIKNDSACLAASQESGSTPLLVSTVLVFSCIHPGLWMSVSSTSLLRSAGWKYLAATQRYSCLRAFAFPLWAQLSFPVPSFLYLCTPPRTVPSSWRLPGGR